MFSFSAWPGNPPPLNSKVIKFHAKHAIIIFRQKVTDYFGRLKCFMWGGKLKFQIRFLTKCHMSQNVVIGEGRSKTNVVGNYAQWIKTDEWTWRISRHFCAESTLFYVDSSKKKLAKKWVSNELSFGGRIWLITVLAQLVFSSKWNRGPKRLNLIFPFFKTMF